MDVEYWVVLGIIILGVLVFLVAINSLMPDNPFD